MLEGSEQSKCVPTRANIIRQLELRLALADRDDLVLVAFSGHGVLEGNTSYLCPYDCVLEKARETMVSMDEIYDRMKRCKAAQKILLVDACRKEPLASLRAPGIRGFGGELKEPPQGLRVLASCDAGQWSAEDPKRRHGVFMYYVIEGLRGAADRQHAGNRNGLVSLEELYEYAYQKTKIAVANAYWISQTPVMKGEIRGSFEIARGDPLRAVPEPAPSKPEPPAAASEPPPKKPETPTALASAPGENPLLLQAQNYRRRGEFDQAIEMYTRAIQDVALDSSVRRRAYEERGISYLARGTRADIEQALRDHISAGKKLHVAVTAATASLQVGQQAQGTVVQNQVLTVGLEDGDWLWVEAVNGDPKLRGYVQKAAVEKAPPERQIASEPSEGSEPESGHFRGATVGRAGYAQERESPVAAAIERRLEKIEEQYENAVAEGRALKAKALENQLRPYYRAQERSSGRGEQGGSRRSR
jgi:tetratricopeptide (TPR) repeat protein